MPPGEKGKLLCGFDVALKQSFMKISNLLPDIIERILY